MTSAIANKDRCAVASEAAVMGMLATCRPRATTSAKSDRKQTGIGQTFRPCGARR